MKTIKKAILGMLFLMPLLLPAETKAGDPGHFYRPPAFNGPLDRSLDHSQDDHFFSPGQRGMREGNHNRDNSFRPYDPWVDRHPNSPGYAGGGDPASGGNPGGNGGNAVPIDGGLVFLLIAGLGLGLWKMYEFKKRTPAVA